MFVFECTHFEIEIWEGRYLKSFHRISIDFLQLVFPVNTRNQDAENDMFGHLLSRDSFLKIFLSASNLQKKKHFEGEI